MSYAELHCLSNFSFLRGASHPEELVEQAAKLGYGAIAITDECSVAGVVRAHTMAKQHKIKLIIGSEFRLHCGMKVVALAPTRTAYGQLCRLITMARRSCPKGRYEVSREQFADQLHDALILLVPESALDLPKPDIQWWQRHFLKRWWLSIELVGDGFDQGRLERFNALAKLYKFPLVSSSGVLMHVRRRRILHNVLTAIRLNTPVSELEFSAQKNGERHLRSIKKIHDWYPNALIEEAIAISDRCRFSLDELRYEYPKELVPKGKSACCYLRELVLAGASKRWPDGVPRKINALLDRELKLISDLNYEEFFLTVHDIVNFARAKNILCQGRGSAANSAVCFALGITEVDPARMSLLFERFISKERNEPPDIDVDFEHQRREEVIQYIYQKYGRERAALAATVISYRSRSAVRDVGKALGVDPVQADRLAKQCRWRDGDALTDERVCDVGLNPESRLVKQWLSLAKEIQGFPRHLSQHVGGFVISRGPLSELVPIENASMPERTVIQWDKDDLENLGLLKVDVLGLGMLSVIRRSFELIKDFDGRDYTMANVPAEDPKVYEMISRGDTTGVFQIESRAQMAMLPRLQPRSFYDLVIEIALVRPGPIQGDMVHPYLRRRSGEEAVVYPSPEIKQVLERTLGVPIFQEQVMKVAMVAAGFSPGEADQLRRAMAAWKRKGGLEPFRDKLIHGMLARGYEREFAERVFKQIKGFGDYGFPESHAASFALLAYVSSWLKCHEPAAFTAALLNSQPMGFYGPSQLVQSTKRQGVEVRPVDVCKSQVYSSLEKSMCGRPALRLGLHLVKELSFEGAQRVISARQICVFSDVQDLARRAQLDKTDLNALAAADALCDLAGHRHQAFWQSTGVETQGPSWLLQSDSHIVPLLRKPTEGEDVMHDYNQLRLSLRRHPLAILRTRLDREGIMTAQALSGIKDMARTKTAGIVTAKQRPGTASGVTFVTLEDETGAINVVIWAGVAKRQRKILMDSRLLGVYGQIQKKNGVLHVIATKLFDHTSLLGQLDTHSRDFH